MKHIKIFGRGCKNCALTQAQIEDVAQTLNIAIELEKITQLEEIMQAGVLLTPAVSVNDVVMHAGSIPTREQIALWLQ